MPIAPYREGSPMRLLLLIALLPFALAAPAYAELNAYYRGVERKTGKDVPATAEFSIEPGRIAVILKGSRDSRMLFFEKEGVLRIVDDSGKTYFDMRQGSSHASPTAAPDMAAEMEKQMAQLPPEQRKMAEGMMQKAMVSGKSASPSEYVWTKEKAKVLGYECTKVEVMQGGTKRAEYWGSPSGDFKMSGPERTTMLAMQEYLRNFTIQVKPADSGEGGSRAFQWDTSVDGYPLISRCFDSGKMTLELTLEKFDRKPLDESLFAVPTEYKEFKMPALGE